jgi:hypothetical protein
MLKQLLVEILTSVASRPWDCCAAVLHPAAMWTAVRQREDDEERCERLIRLYDQQIAQFEASKQTPYWDGESETRVACCMQAL